jgi:hypothetical protein
MRTRQIASLVLSFCPLALVAQPATPTAFVTTIGKDTLCLEQYSRAGNLISGTWVVLHPPGVFVHDYLITLGNDGLPVQYRMKYSTPGARTSPDLDSLTVIYGRDSASLTFFQHDSSFVRRVAMHEAVPLLGQSFVGVELALMRLRTMRLDSSTITLHPPSDPSSPITRAPVRFFASDSALVASTIRVHVGEDGRILGLRFGRAELRRVNAFEMSRSVDGFVKAFAPRVAAAEAAAASRVEISLSATQLVRFVGEYSVGATTISIARDGEHLVLHLPRQPAIQLLAMAPTEFFVKKPDLVLTFQTDATGRVTGLTIEQGETKNRFVRRN